MAGALDFSEFQKKSEFTNFSLEELLDITSKTEIEHDHQYYNRVIKHPTCIHTGIRRYSCLYNDDHYDEVIPATGIHDFLSEITIEPTHLTEGERYYHCRDCEENYTEKVPKIVEHTYTSLIVKSPTCISTGIERFICECGDTYEEELATIPHNYVDNVCTMCGEQDYEDFSLNINNYEMAGLEALTGDVKIPNTFIYEDKQYQTVRVVYPGSVTELSDGVLEGNDRLVSVAISSSTKTIGKNVFKGCTKLERVEMTPNVESIGDYAFEGCEKLTTLSTYHIYEAYIGAGAVTYNTVPDATKTIGKYAFSGCTLLSPFYIHPGIESIGTNALKGINVAKSTSSTLDISDTGVASVESIP